MLWCNLYDFAWIKFFFCPPKVVFPTTRALATETVVYFSFRMISCAVSHIIYTYCVVAGSGRGRGDAPAVAETYSDDNIIVNVICATRRAPFVRKLAKKYIFLTVAEVEETG